VRSLLAQAVWPRTARSGQYFGYREASNGWILADGGGGRRTAIVRGAFTQLHRHAIEVVAHFLETGREDAEGMVALKAEEQDNDLLATGAVGGVLAVFIGDLRGGLLEDDAVHGGVAQQPERDEALAEEAEGEDEEGEGQGVAGGQGEKEKGLQTGAHEEPCRDGKVGAEDLERVRLWAVMEKGRVKEEMYIKCGF
jgi:hypothetical protein